MRVGVLAVGTASPAHQLEQAKAKAFAASFFGDDFAKEDADALFSTFDHAGIDTRQLALPIDWLERPHSFPEKNAVWTEHALSLSQRAAEKAIVESGIDRTEIGGIVLTTSTGIATPSLDAQLVQTLGLSRAVARVPIWGLGCAGGAAGLARASALARGLDQPILAISCELCSLTFVYGDRRKANVVAVALFGDGAGASVVAPEPWWAPSRGPEILTGYSYLIDRTEHVMGWDLEQEGLRVRFSPGIPAIVEQLAAELVIDAGRSAWLGPGDAIEHLVLHPGGRKVLDAYDAALELRPGALRHSRAVLREHGNMSSPTVIFVLERFLADTRQSGRAGLLLGLGPGFSAEGVVFRW